MPITPYNNQYKSGGTNAPQNFSDDSILYGDTGSGQNLDDEFSVAIPAEFTSVEATVDELVTKADAIEDAADVTDEANVLAALTASDTTKDLGGAAVTNLAGSSGIAGFKYGSYVGTDVDNRNITMGFIPDFIMLWDDGTRLAIVRIGAVSATKYISGGGTQAAVGTDWIQIDGSDGIRVGTSGDLDLNNSGNTYRYFALKFS